MAKLAWEYAMLVANPPHEPAVLDQMNAMGAEGWELVTVASDAAIHYLIFKRETAIAREPVDPMRAFREAGSDLTAGEKKERGA